MKYIKLRKVKGVIEFRFKKIYLGYSYREVDGSYVFVFSKLDGNWSSYVLREIADTLDDLNKEYNNQLNEYFENNKPSPKSIEEG